MQGERITADPTVNLPEIRNWRDRDTFLCDRVPEESPDQGIKDQLINLSYKFQRGICPQGP